MQPIRTKFEYYGDYENENERKAHTEAWFQTLSQLQGVLRKSVDSAFKKGLITMKRHHDYFKSGIMEYACCCFSCQN